MTNQRGEQAEGLRSLRFMPQFDHTPAESGRDAIMELRLVQATGRSLDKTLFYHYDTIFPFMSNQKS